jgi:predicted O-methyltransferase YrrM
VTFGEVFPTLPATGWLTRPEAELLWMVAARCEGAILEVGVFHGRSTCLLAALGRPVYAVDRFSGFDSDDVGGRKAQLAWWENVTARGLDGNTFLFAMRIEDWTPRPVGFAFLDGDHSFAGTVAQIERALLCHPRVIAIHDVNDEGDGRLVRDAALQLLGPWRERVERLAVWEVLP